MALSKKAGIIASIASPHTLSRGPSVPYRFGSHFPARTIRLDGYQLYLATRRLFVSNPSLNSILRFVCYPGFQKRPTMSLSDPDVARWATHYPAQYISWQAPSPVSNFAQARRHRLGKSFHLSPLVSLVQFKVPDENVAPRQGS